MKSRNPLIVEIYRGPVMESSHQVMAVVADERGLVTGFFGNTDYLTPPRSSIKMLQALPFVESGAMEKFGLEEKMLALACSSHHGEKAHLLVAHQWMEKIKVSDAALHCGPSWPVHEGTLHEMIKKNLPRSPLIHNCSGKHLGLISTCLALGENPSGYAKYDHPSQIRLRKVLGEVMRVNLEKLPWGVDGCGIPTIAVPLQTLAIGMSHLLTSPVSQTRKQALQKILEACKRHPQLLAGTESFATVVNERTQGRVILKTGAEGVYTGLLTEKGYAFALKVHDGNARAAEVAASWIVKQWGGLTEAEFQDLKSYTQPEVKNSRGEKVGEIRVQKVG